jgi:hypothetical protein
MLPSRLCHIIHHRFVDGMVRYRNWIVWVAGVVQTAIYCDFFYYYIIAAWNGKQFALPL